MNIGAADAVSEDDLQVIFDEIGNGEEIPTQEMIQLL